MIFSIPHDAHALPLSHACVTLLTDYLNQAVQDQNPDRSITAATFNFRDPDYSADQGGYHPVEIRVKVQGETGTLEYITDFSYVGTGQDCELDKEVDFDFTGNYCFVRYVGRYALEDMHNFYRIWEGNFMNYIEMRVFHLDVTLETE